VSYTCREKQLSNPNQPCTPRISVVVGWGNLSHRYRKRIEQA